MNDLHQFVGHWGYAAIFVVVVLGNVGLPVPEETILALAGYLVWRGKLRLSLVLVVGIVSAVVGDNIGYWLGRRYGQIALPRYARWVLGHPERLETMKAFVARRGPVAVFVARFVPGVRFTAGPLAGALGLPFSSFLLANVAGAKIQNARLMAEAAEKRQMDREFALAQEIQQRLLPDRPPTVPGYELYGSNIPSRQVSGDYFDFRPRPDGKVYVATRGGVTVVDPDGDSVGAVVPGIRDPSSLSYDRADNKVYAVQRGRGLVSVIDAGGDTIIAAVSVPPSSQQTCWNQNHNKLYVCAPGDTERCITVIDCATDTVVRRLYSTSWPTAAFSDTVSDKIYVVAAPELHFIDAATDSLYRTLTLGSIGAMMLHYVVIGPKRIDEGADKEGHHE